MSRPKIAVVGHVEHVTLGLVDAPPSPGDIVHLQHARTLPGGGGGLAFAQLARSDADVAFFTAIGSDDAGAWIRDQLARSGANVTIHAAARSEPHPRGVVMVDAAGRRTIVVPYDPLQPRANDPLPWASLTDFDAVYFTGSDPGSLALARKARLLLATARRRPTVDASGVVLDVAIGSASDPRENAPLAAYAKKPRALVLTDGPRPIRVVRENAMVEVGPPPHVDAPKGDYGAGDSFAAALTYFMACGEPLESAVRHAGPFGAAVLRGVDPLEVQLALGSSGSSS